MALRVEDYALIGDTHTAALVGRDGSIDWLCLPRFDSGACFAALLGNASHGRWLIAPQPSAHAIRRRYRPDTLILETDFETDEGVVRLVDCMTPRQDEPDVIRVVQGLRGTVSMKMELVIPVRLRPRGAVGSAHRWASPSDRGAGRAGALDRCSDVGHGPHHASNVYHS